MSVVVAALALGEGDRSVMVKDTIDVAGVATRAGSRALADAAPAQTHARVVQQLLDAGWHLNGKTNLHELAFGTTGINHWSGTPENPRYPGLIPGGSSSGSAAAVAGELCDAALGTDTGGSIRVPAACCGVIGLKPTFGRVSREGVMPAQTTLDCVGPFARNMDTLTAVMAAICSDFVPVELPAGLMIGQVAVTAGPEILSCIEDALKSSDFQLKAVDLPGMSAAYEAGMTLINRESWLGSRAYVETGLVAEDVAGRLWAASHTSDEQLVAADQVRAAFTAEVDAALAECPVLALPTLPEYPIAVADAADTRALLGMTALVRPFNLTGHPAISLPLVGRSGLPVGLQLVAARGADELLCAVASEFARRLAYQ